MSVHSEVQSIREVSEAWEVTQAEAIARIRMYPLREWARDKGRVFCFVGRIFSNGNQVVGGSVPHGMKVCFTGTLAVVVS